MSMIKRNTNEQRESIIAMALETPEGRTALAQAMVEPITTSLWSFKSHCNNGLSLLISISLNH